MKMRKKSSKKRFKVATTSFLAAVLLSLSLNSSKVYMAEENVNYIPLGKVQLVDKATGNVIAQQVYANDPSDATKAARTKLPKVPEGYKFVSENLTLQNSAIEKVTKVHKGQGGGKEIIKSEITLTKVGDDLFFNPTNDQVQPLVDGASFSYSQGNNVIFYIVKNEPEKPAEEPKKPEPKKPEPKRENPAPKRGLPKTGVETTSVVVPTLGAILAGFAFRRNRKNK